jgi:glucosylglycerol phosphorylase (configuration-retaining)
MCWRCSNSCARSPPKTGKRPDAAARRRALPPRIPIDAPAQPGPADRLSRPLGADLAELHDIIDRHFAKAIGGVHILPPYPSNADGGFSPLTHKEIDPKYGTWADVEKISARFDLCLDLTLNHISDESEEFKDFLAKGYDSEYADLFVHVDQLGPISPDDLARIHIRKEKEPFREVTFADGSHGRVWCTFTEHQIDLNYNSPKTYALMEDYIKFLAARGVKLFRLDAFGYTTKKIGTSCFLVEPDVYDILKWVDGVARENGAETLPEVHDHASFQYAIALHGMHPYGFALAPLLLYSLLDANSVYLKQWLRMCPRNQLTVLDTHDGICIPDVEGVLPRDKIQAVIDNVSQRSADPILRRSAANVHSVGAIYQLTCTYYDALKRNDDAYIAARAIQFFAPGIPQVYYVGLLAGSNDPNRWKPPASSATSTATLQRGRGRRGGEATRGARLLKLMEFRSSYPAFDGVFHLMYSNDSSVAMCWRTANSAASCSSTSTSRRRRLCRLRRRQVQALAEHALSRRGLANGPNRSSAADQPRPEIALGATSCSRQAHSSAARAGGGCAGAGRLHQPAIRAAARRVRRRFPASRCGALAGRAALPCIRGIGGKVRARACAG